MWWKSSIKNGGFENWLKKKELEHGHQGEGLTWIPCIIRWGGLNFDKTHSEGCNKRMNIILGTQWDGHL
jgi:hypothetical protein